MHLDDLSSFAELTDEHMAVAARSSSSMRAFLAWASDVARPGRGASKVLAVIARLATVDWVEGTPYVEIRGDATTTAISIFADYGIGIRERIVPLARLHAPFRELTDAVAADPEIAAPFVATRRADALYLTMPGMALTASIAPGSNPPIAIDARCLQPVELANDEAPATRPAPPLVEKRPEPAGVHTAPTVRRMVAIRPEAFRSGNRE